MRYLYRDINDFKKGYQHRTNTVDDEMVILVTDCHCILTRRRKRFSQQFNAHGVSDVS